MNQKTAGTLLHITSLPNQFPIGDLGPCAYEFVNFLSGSAQRWWQMLPIGPAGKNNSPYQSCSAFGGNPLLISPEVLVKQGLLHKQDILLRTSFESDKVNYHKAKQLKSQLLKVAFRNFEKEKKSHQHYEFDAFVHAESYWLDDFALFAAIQRKERTSDWTQWDRALKFRHTAALMHAKKSFATDIRYHKFIQWQFSTQWQALYNYCKNKRISLIGDIPIFVAHQSADVWAHSDIFKLDINGKPIVTAGVPPDYFSKTGQLWHIPVYCWNALKKQYYDWWIKRLQNSLKHFDILRLDHFIGFIRTYEVAAHAKTAQNGKYRPGGGLHFFASLQKALGHLPFIADDLGAITNEVKILRHKLNIPGTKVLQFELDRELNNSALERARSQCDRASSRGLTAGSSGSSMGLAVMPRDDKILYTGTHDNDTSLGWYKSFASKQRKILCQKLHTNTDDFHWSMIRAALAAQVDTVIIPMQDILGLGSDARMNFPGKAKGNWKWRLKSGALNPVLAKKMLKLIQNFNRAG